MKHTTHIDNQHEDTTKNKQTKLEPHNNLVVGESKNEP